MTDAVTDPGPRARDRDVSILGYRLHPMTGTEVVAEIAGAVAERRRLVMANLNLHGMATMFESGGMAALLHQDDAAVMIDSMPVLFLANLFGHGLSRDKRTTSLDFYDDMFRLGAERGWRFGYVGGHPDVLARGLAVLRSRFPGLRIDGRDGYFDMDDQGPGSDHSEILAWMTAQSHDVVIAGMGMPRQEEWVWRVQERVPTRVFLTAGAYLDYQVGIQRPAPRWLGQVGLEWAYRLLRSPRRLSHRYLVEPLILLCRLLTRTHPGRRFRRG